MILCRFLLKAHLVYKKLNLGQIGVNGELYCVALSFSVTLAADVDKGFVGKPCLIGVKGIFFIFSVKGDKTLVILSVFSALISCICATLPVR